MNEKLTDEQNARFVNKRPANKNGFQFDRNGDVLDGAGNFVD